MKKIGFYLLLISFLSCSKDNDDIINTDLVGIWENTFILEIGDISSVQEEGFEHVVQYTFNLNQSFEYGSFIRNIDSGSILAYSHRYLGHYGIEGNRLNLIFEHWGAEPLDNQYSELKNINELVLVTENETWSFSYSISQNKKLVFDYDPCGPLENCIDKSTLYRIK
ncbi:lipocalin family protein [Maribacter sp. HTCC2170]|uniref:lipocalin family protein n=1 Tax=Maribacter sp. (strain HTCC2170 / KCCM 42371) TaxID=313603 RepID=UPI00006BE0E0|nr:lipocalin family protein [Maribacter sp. HTCC2170]EAR00022.1 hypothetical protein FB2170_01572 [Maribacter sp. HTCC2170]